MEQTDAGLISLRRRSEPPKHPGAGSMRCSWTSTHSPRHVLGPSHRGFYAAAGLEGLRGHLVPGGVFGLWSDDPPDDGFEAVLTEVDSHVVTFPNFYTGEPSANTVYVARADAQRP